MNFDQLIEEIKSQYTDDDGNPVDLSLVDFEIDDSDGQSYDGQQQRWFTVNAVWKDDKEVALIEKQKELERLLKIEEMKLRKELFGD